MVTSGLSHSQNVSFVWSTGFRLDLSVRVCPLVIVFVNAFVVPYPWVKLTEALVPPPTPKTPPPAEKVKVTPALNELLTLLVEP
jgi:hypothetical protein